jgi:colicin import membrane protein
MPSDIDRIEFIPRREPGALRSFGLALLVHLLLVAALTWGVNWTRSKPDIAFEAELWSTLPQEAAPKPRAAPEPPPPPPPEIKPPTPAPAPPPPPPPAPEPVLKPTPAPPPEVDIALEQEKKRKLQQKKEAEDKLAAELKKKEEQAQKAKALELAKRQAEEEAKKREAQQAEAKRLEAEALAAKKREAEKLAAEKKEAERVAAKKREMEKLAAEKREAERAAKLRQENLERMAGQAGATGADDAKGTAQQSSGPSGSYAGKVRAKVKPNIVFTETISGNPTAEVEVRTTLDGSISSQRLIKSSGNKAWDDAVMKAIVRTRSMPRDIDGRVPSPMILEFRPND